MRLCVCVCVCVCVNQDELYTFKGLSKGRDWDRLSVNIELNQINQVDRNMTPNNAILLSICWLCYLAWYKPYKAMICEITVICTQWSY